MINFFDHIASDGFKFPGGSVIANNYLFACKMCQLPHLLNYPFRLLNFLSAAHSFEERLENLVLRLNLSLWMSWRHFLVKTNYNFDSFVAEDERSCEAVCHMMWMVLDCFTWSIFLVTFSQTRILLGSGILVVNVIVMYEATRTPFCVQNVIVRLIRSVLVWESISLNIT